MPKTRRRRSARGARRARGRGARRFAVVIPPAFRGAARAVWERPAVVRAWRMGRRVDWHIAAALALTAVAAGLRFYNLADDGLGYDEAVAALNSRGSLSDVLRDTRHVNSSPILYPLVLWAVQLVNSSAFSVRMVSAAASAAVVAVLLFGLPRAGVSRKAAFIAALLAAFSARAIEYAQGVREYSVDALIAAALVVGVLRLLRNGDVRLLCAALFVAPLVQYGLIIAGAGAVAAAAIWSAFGGAASAKTPLERAARWAKSAVPPAAFFIAGCAITYALTMRSHLGKAHLRTNYADGLYQGELGDAAAALDFAASQIWAMLNWHLPMSAAAVGVALFAPAFVFAALRRRRFETAAFSVVALTVAAAVCAALLARYPLGEFRVNTYLSAAAFIGAGLGLAMAADALGALTRRRWTAGALIAIIAAGAALAGVGDIRSENPYRTGSNIAAAISTLQERAKPGDLIYASDDEAPKAEFYLGKDKPPNYRYGTKRCGDPLNDGCFSEIADAAREMGGADRIWILHYAFDRLHKDMRNALAGGEYADVGEGVSRLLLADGESDVALLSAGGDAAENVARRLDERFAEVTAERPDMRGGFDVYADGDSVIYAKSPCVEEDTRGRFRLSVAPAYQRDLPAESRLSGQESLNFSFSVEGSLFNGKCLIRIPLPDYPIGAVGVGQWNTGGADWTGAIRFDAGLDELRETHRAALASTPALRSVFDVYLNGDSLIYVKEPCSEDDIRGRFQLAAFPVDESNLPEEARMNGAAHVAFNFEFPLRGAAFDGGCVARAALPEYPLAQIQTGQWIPGGSAIWGERILLDGYFEKYGAALSAISGKTPAASSVFDLYADDNSLTYAKQPCRQRDIQGRFLLAAFPSDPANLTDAARESGLDHNSLNFSFNDRGALLDGACVAVVPLPEYPIDAVETGQWLPGNAPIWSERIEMGGR